MIHELMLLPKHICLLKLQTRFPIQVILGDRLYK